MPITEMALQTLPVQVPPAGIWMEWAVARAAGSVALVASFERRRIAIAFEACGLWMMTSYIEP